MNIGGGDIEIGLAVDRRMRMHYLCSVREECGGGDCRSYPPLPFLNSIQVSEQTLSLCRLPLRGGLQKMYWQRLSAALRDGILCGWPDDLELFD